MLVQHCDTGELTAQSVFEEYKMKSGCDQKVQFLNASTAEKRTDNLRLVFEVQMHTSGDTHFVLEGEFPKLRILSPFNPHRCMPVKVPNVPSSQFG